MRDLIWLSEAQMRRIEPYFPLSHGIPRVDDRRVLSGIVFVIRNGQSFPVCSFQLRLTYSKMSLLHPSPERGA